MKLLSIYFTTSVNPTVTSFKNFSNLKKLQLYIWCFNPCHHNLLSMRICFCACICWSFQFACSAYCPLYKCWLAAFHLNRVGTVPKMFQTNTSSSFEALIFQWSFDSCIHFCANHGWKIFLWFEYLVFNFVSDMR